MTQRIVVFGATGYSGQLTVKALVERGAKPVLAGRDETKLQALGKGLGGLEHAVADVDRPESVKALVGAGDVLVSLVGPFVRWGHPAVQAALAVGAQYLDSTGEPSFIREVFEGYGPRAAQQGIGLVTAMGYDYVPGNLAAGLACRDAAGAAWRVEVGYFVSGPMSPAGLSGGTRASLTGALLEPGHALRDGQLRQEHGGVRHRSFNVGGKRRQAVSVGMSEHFAVPQSFPEVRNVATYLGWFGAASRPISLLARTSGGLARVPQLRRVARTTSARLVKGSTGGPDQRRRARYTTLVVAEAFDDGGRQVGRAVVEGINPYDFTGRMLAWAAQHTAEQGLEGVGGLGPVAAFGLDELQAGVAQAGLLRSE